MGAQMGETAGASAAMLCGMNEHRSAPAAMPPIGLGTWKSAPDEVGAAVEAALRLGYRHVDCAAIYGNEAEVGAALERSFADGVVRRDDLWITSKLWNDHHRPEDVAQGLERTLSELGLAYLDLYLIHWPVVHRPGVRVPETAEDFVALDDLPLTETWRGMEAQVDAGRTRHIGLSNCSVPKLRSVLESARIAPYANQVELHPYLQQRELLEYCQDHDVVVTAYSPLGSPDRPDTMKAEDEPVLLADPVVLEIARAHEASPAQVVLAWALARGTTVLPKTVRPQRLRENLAAAELALTADERVRLDALDRARRYVDGRFWEREGGPYTVGNLWDEEPVSG